MVAQQEGYASCPEAGRERPVAGLAPPHAWRLADQDQGAREECVLRVWHLRAHWVAQWVTIPCVHHLHMLPVSDAHDAYFF